MKKNYEKKNNDGAIKQIHDKYKDKGTEMDNKIS